MIHIYMRHQKLLTKFLFSDCKHSWFSIFKFYEKEYCSQNRGYHLHETMLAMWDADWLV